MRYYFELVIRGIQLICIIRDLRDGMKHQSQSVICEILSLIRAICGKKKGRNRNSALFKIQYPMKNQDETKICYWSKQYGKYGI